MALNRREKAMLTLPVLLGGMMGFYNWVHEPLFERREQAFTRHLQLQTELRREQGRLSREGDLEARRSTVAAREQLIDSWVPGRNSAALLVWHLSQAQRYSGVRIRGVTLSEAKEMSPLPPAKEGNAKAAGSASPAPSLTVINLNLTVEARFAEHLLFHQQLEQMPLFIRTDAFSLSRDAGPDLSEAQRLVEAGNSIAAEQLLRVSPRLNSTYNVNLYFKHKKPGPLTEAIEGGETGRLDPFATANVAEFVQYLRDYFSQAGSGDFGPPHDGWGLPDHQGPGAGQLG